MAKVDGYQGVSTYTDRNGHVRFRYRSGNRSVSLPTTPGSPEFDAAYQAAIEGRKPTQLDTMTAIGRESGPRTLGAAWRRVLTSPEWAILDDQTKKKNTTLATGFLKSRVVSDSPILWRDIAVAEIKRRHVKTILAAHIATPHKAKHLLVAIRKMIAVAIDEEWIDFDPSARIHWRPKHKGWRAWTMKELVQYQEFWQRGTTARTVFSLALWLGVRRADIPQLRWDKMDLANRRCETNIIKGDGKAALKLSLRLIEDLMAINGRGEYVITTEAGRQFSEKSLTNKMQEWTRKAGLPPGCTIHGLRKTLGKLAAEGGATTRMSMELLGHDNIDHVELYSREADSENLAADALDCAVRAYERQLATLG